MPKIIKKIRQSTVVKIRLILSLILLAALSSLILARLVPSGRIFYNRDFSRSWQFFGGQGFIGQFSPAERIDFKTSDYVKLIADPVYFSVFTPRFFTRARLIITYQDYLASSTPIVEAGVLMDKIVWQYQMKPVVNKILDNLNWPTLTEGGLTLYERQKPVADLAYFIQRAGERSDLALYNYSLLRPYYLDNYSPAKSTRIMAAGLRGPYQFYTYLDGEDFNLTFWFQDLNQNYDLKGDGVTVLVSDYKGQNILTRRVRDDGIIADTGQLSAQSVLAFVIKDLPRGVYKVEVKANDDIVTRKIITSQTKLTFINKLWLVDETVAAFDLYTNVNNLKATAFGPGGEQILAYNREPLSVDAPYQQFYKRVDFAGPDHLYLINLKPRNLIVENNGLFAFNQAAFINPDFKKVDSNWEADDSINYILSAYQSPTVLGPDKIAVLDFDLSNAYRENHKYSLMISIPGLYANNQARQLAGLAPAYLEIKEIRLELEGKSLGDKLKELWRENIKPKLGLGVKK
ncbi:MAG: hypothetical protein NTX66_01115 [Candidatus Falkowbacteria bacterium]|nr:hypothetical protein [Candidatus Falkowbacteria bacterium]